MHSYFLDYHAMSSLALPSTTDQMNPRNLVVVLVHFSAKQLYALSKSGASVIRQINVS